MQLLMLQTKVVATNEQYFLSSHPFMPVLLAHKVFYLSSLVQQDQL